jgi:23S rRNA (adenine2503-C2)-methyltransferase
MGMGEPMDNLDAVLAVCSILTSDWGLGWSPKRITVSSVGIIPGLKRFIEESQCHLAISLHNPVPQERLAIMPVQKAFPLSEVLALLRQHDWSGQRRLSFEYTMFRGLNDDLAHATRLAEALRGLDCRVNLIRFHSSPGTPYQTSTPSAIRAFQDFLNRNGVVCTLRASRGEDIDAACGLLAGREGR